MGRPRRRLPEGSVEKLHAALQKVRTVGQHKRVLAVWLRALLGLDNRQVAAVLDWGPSQVSKVQCRYLREGDAAFRGPGRGGDRRPTYLRRAARQALLSDLLYLNQKHGLRLSFRTVKGECEAAAGHSLHRSTIYRIIRLHGWQPSQLDREIPPEIKAALSPEGAQLPGAWEVLHNLLLKDFPVP
jgi:transposase